MVEKAHEYLFEQAGHFADLDHRQIERRKNTRVTRQAGRQLPPAFQTFAQILNYRPHRRVDRRLLQTAQRTHDRHAGLEQGVDLPAEQHDVDMRNPGFEQGDFDAGSLAGWRFGLANFDRNQPLPEQNVGHRARVGAFGHALDQLPARITPFVREAWHGQVLFLTTENTEFTEKTQKETKIEFFKIDMYVSFHMETRLIPSFINFVLKFNSRPRLIFNKRR